MNGREKRWPQPAVVDLKLCSGKLWVEHAFRRAIEDPSKYVGVSR
jgi:hypothetical protein